MNYSSPDRVRIGIVSETHVQDVALIAHDLGIDLRYEPSVRSRVVPKDGSQEDATVQYWTLMAPRPESAATLALASSIFATPDATWEADDSSLNRINAQAVRGAVETGGRVLEYFHFPRPEPGVNDGVMVMRDTANGEVRYYSLPFSTRDLEIAVVEAAWKLAKRRVT